MLRHRLTAAAVLAVVLVVVTLLAPAAAEASTRTADIPGPIGNAWDLMNYPLSVTSSELYSMNSDVAKASWGPEYARVAASQAGGYAASGVYGNLDFGPATPGYKSGVVPIDKTTPFKPPRRPVFSQVGWKRNLAGGAGATVALMAYDRRADIANGVLGWVGVNAHGNVCSDPVFGGSNPLNWLTGQDCSDYHLTSQEYKDWQSSNAQLVFGEACNPAHPSFCYSIKGQALFVWGAWGQQVANCWSIPTTSLPNEWPQHGWAMSGKWPGSDGYQLLTGIANYPGDDGVIACKSQVPSSNAAMWDAGGNPYDHITSYRWTDIGSEPSPDGAAADVLSSLDELHTVHCLVTFTDGTTTYGDTQPFKAGAANRPDPLCGSVPDGKVIAHQTVTEFGPGGSWVLSDQDSTAPYKIKAAEDAANCTGVRKACILDLIDVTTGVTCFKEADTCDGWLQDPNRDTKYACYYGGSAVAVNECYVYATTFSATKRLAGDGYADPKTGDDVGAAGPTSRSADEALMGKGFGTPTAPFSWTSCFGGTYSAFNPIEWALKPMQCALKWAFVTRPQAVQMDLNGLTNQWGDTAPVKMITAVAAWKFTPVATGCAGPHLDIHFPIFGGSTFDYTGNPVSACPGTPIAPIADTAKTFTTVFAILLGAYAIINLLGSVVGFRIGGARDDD